MERQKQFNLAGNFLHVGGEEYVPMRNIRSVEVLTDADRAQMADRYPQARTDFQYRVQFWDRSQKLVTDLDAAPGVFVQVDDSVLVPVANVQGLKPLTEDDRLKLRVRYPNTEREFQTRIEGNVDSQSFLSTWTVAQITGMGPETLSSAPTVDQGARRRSRGNSAEHKPAVQ